MLLTAQTKALSAKLSTKHVRTRQHLGMALSYIEGWHAIAEANRIFGFDAWDREMLEARCVWEAVRQGRYHCSYTAQVRIRVWAGDIVVAREGSGAGHGSAATPGEAHESALKEGTEKGEHYANILASLYRGRLDALRKNGQANSCPRRWEER